MEPYWAEFLKVALAHALAVASPGPDFAVVLKQVLARGRRAGRWTSLGIGTGIVVHITYSLLGLGLVIRNSELWFNVLKNLGAVYIGWLGVQSLRARAPSVDPVVAHASHDSDSRGARAAFLTGFLTNALNPKATLFFISLFVVLINPTTPKVIQAAYGLWMVAATCAWFSFVTIAFTRREVRRKFIQHGHWIERALGVVFIAFAVSLFAARLR